MLLGASLALTILPVAFGAHYARTWWKERAGRTVEEQRAALEGVPWFKSGYVRLVERLERTLPPDARLLVEPMRETITPESLTGERRWYLFLDYDLYPIEVFVRAPGLASGTLVDYPRWLEHHLAGTDAIAAELAIVESGIEWRLRYPVEPGLEPREIELSRLVDGEWVRWELAPRTGAPGGWPAERRPAGGGADG
jgi:hypothetical protein